MSTRTGYCIYDLTTGEIQNYGTTSGPLPTPPSGCGVVEFPYVLPDNMRNCWWNGTAIVEKSDYPMVLDGTKIINLPSDADVRLGRTSLTKVGDTCELQGQVTEDGTHRVKVWSVQYLTKSCLVTVSGGNVQTIVIE